MRYLVWALVAAIGVSGCGPEEASVTDWPSAADRTMREGTAPTPFTAAQIREACAPGRRSTFRVEVKGQEPFLQIFHFLERDEEGCGLEMIRTNLEGTPLAPPAKSRSTWKELQAHASYALETTTVRDGEVTVPAGTFDGFLYIVEASAGGKANVTQAFFARTLPGPPVELVQLVKGETIMTMTLVEHEPGSR